MRADMKQSSMDIPAFFESRSILITGGTGFMGKVLVEKLLRSCPELKKIYLLVRSQDKCQANERLNDLLFKSQLFQRVREESPSALFKVVAVEGDVTLPGLGLNDKDTRIVTRDVSIVFHVAATVRFNESLRVAAKINVEGTKNTAELAKKMANLKAFVHVSTAYSNCNRKFIDEVVYPASMPPNSFLDIFKKYGNSEIEKMTPELIKGHPNTYTFTKQMAENYLADHCRDLPLIITRPAVVTAAWLEPFPGWIDNKFGATGTLIAIGKGILHTLLANMDYPAEIFPVDIGVNHMIAAAWEVGTNKGDSSTIKVLNGVSSPVNPLLKRNMPRICYNVVEKYPLGKPYRYPNCTVTTNRTMFNILYFLQHYVPASLADLYFMVKGQKPCAIDSYRKLYNALDEYSIFQLSENLYCCDNVLNLQDRLSPKDQETFNLSLKNMDWSKYMKNYGMGIRRWVLKEGDDTLPEARRQLRSLYFKTQLVNASFVAALGLWLWHKGIFQTVSSLVF